MLGSNPGRQAIEMNAIHVDNVKDVIDGPGLNQEHEVVRAGLAALSGLEHERGLRRTVIAAGIFGDTGVFDFKIRFDILEQPRLQAQNGLGIIVKIGIAVRLRHGGNGEKKNQGQKSKKSHTF